MAGMVLFLVAAAAFIATGFLSGCDRASLKTEPVNTGTPQSPSPTTLPTVSGSASWGASFETLAELCSSSDLVAAGVIDRVASVETDKRVALFFTKFVFRIEKTYKGNETAEVLLNITGAPDKPGSDLPEDPLFNVGERWVLFLREYEEGRYYSLGPWGRYKVVDGRVYSMNRLLSMSWYSFPELDFQGVEMETFDRRLTDVLDTVSLTLLDSHKTPDTALRFTAGFTQTLFPTLSTGKFGPADVSYEVARVDAKDSENRVPMPPGMEVTIEPDQFHAEPGQEYRSVMTIRTSRDFQWGTYWLVVRCRYGEVDVRPWQLMVNVMPAGGEVGVTP